MNLGTLPLVSSLCIYAGKKEMILEEWNHIIHVTFEKQYYIYVYFNKLQIVEVITSIQIFFTHARLFPIRSL